MILLKRLVCPIDFSEPSLRGLSVGSRIAKHFSADLIIVHVITPFPTYAVPGISSASGSGGGGFDVDGYIQHVEYEAATSLDALLKSVAESVEEVRSELLSGPAAESIVSCAQDEKADAIVMATHGHTGIRRFITGSVTEKVVRLAGCPVVTVPGEL